MSPEGEQQVNATQPATPRTEPEPGTQEQKTEESEKLETLQPPEESPGVGKRVGELLKKPPVGASIAGTVVLGVASAFGVLEAAIAAGAAYAAYKILRKKTASEKT